MEENDVLFVKVKSPIELRRAVLETTKDVIETLQRYERFKALKEEKLARITTLKGDIREITTLINKLKSSLPKTNIRLKEAEIKEPEPKPKKSSVKSGRKIKVKEDVDEKVSEVKKKELTELEKLESELKDIEGHLNKIR